MDGLSNFGAPESTIHGVGAESQARVVEADGKKKKKKKKDKDGEKKEKKEKKDKKLKVKELFDDGDGDLGVSAEGIEGAANAT